MFIFSDQKNKKQRKAKKKKDESLKVKARAETGRVGGDGWSCACHLFPIEEVVRHSSVGSTDVSQTKEITENQK